MDNLNQYRTLIQELLTAQTQHPYAYDNIQFETVFDTQADRYLLMILGRDYENRRVHGCLIHVDIIDNQLWIQRDGTEHGVATDLIEAGIPKESIVLGFRQSGY
jgi:hypothetical protein